MIKLLRSNLLRLVKSKKFYIVLAIQAALVLIMTLNYYLPTLQGGSRGWPDLVFKYTACSTETAILLAVLCSLFIGSDYSNGTIRNKLIIGLPRPKVYLANLITVMTGALCLNIAAMLVFYPVTVPLLGGEFISEAKTLLRIFFVGNLILLVYASLFTFVAMTTKSTVASLILTVAGIFVMLTVGQYLIAQIDEPLTYTEAIMNDFGEIVTQVVPNPYRKSESLLAFFEVLLNLFPSGQLRVLGSDKCVVWQQVVSSVCVLCASTGAGLAIFSKENLK